MFSEGFFLRVIKSSDCVVKDNRKSSAVQIQMHFTLCHTYVELGVLATLLFDSDSVIGVFSLDLDCFGEGGGVPS